MMDALILRRNPKDLGRFAGPLARNGFRAVAVSSAEEALEACRGGRVGVVVLPWTGARAEVNLLRGIRKQDETGGRHTCVIALIRRSDARGEIRALDAGADICLSPLVSAPLFAARLRAGLKRFGATGAAPSTAVGAAAGSASETKFRALFE
jgi:DNA-binding response OmpR family regulator